MAEEQVQVSVRLEPQTNSSGDASIAAQGFGRVSREPAPAFDPERDIDAAYAFFAQHGYVVLSNCLSEGELGYLNAFCDRTQRERPKSWGLTDKRKPHHRNQGLIFSQPLLDYPELDPYTRHPRSFPWWPACWAAKTRSASPSSISARRPRARARGR